MSKFKRGGHLVRSRVQRAVILRFMLHWFAFAGCFVGTVFCMHFFLGGDPDASVSSILHEMWQRYALLAVVAFALVPYFLYDLIKLTHRFAGPMVRFGDALNRAALGEIVEPISFRDGDYWHELASDFNIVIAKLPHDHIVASASSLVAVNNSESVLDESHELVTT